jgi:hypothetical protein
VTADGKGCAASGGGGGAEQLVTSGARCAAWDRDECTSKRSLGPSTSAGGRAHPALVFSLAHP